MSSNLGGYRPGAGRPPKRGTPMFRSAFTAPVEYAVFYLLLGEENTVSAGIQEAVERLRGATDMEKLYQQAGYVVEQTKESLGNDADASSIMKYVRENYEQILQDRNG